MTRSRFTIVKEKRPDRCDICHKSDLFDPQTGICERCKHLPVEQLTNQDVNSIQTIPSSAVASTVAATIACLCFSASLAILNGFFGPSSARTFFYGLLLLSTINLFASIAINRWCSDQYSERLDHRVAAAGTFSSGIGLITSLIGLIFSFSRLITR